MHRLYEQADLLTKEVIAAAIDVHKYFGPGLLESIYVKCLAQALRVAGHQVEQEKQVTVSYMGAKFDERLRCDLLVDDCLKGTMLRGVGDWMGVVRCNGYGAGE